MSFKLILRKSNYRQGLHLVGLVDEHGYPIHRWMKVKSPTKNDYLRSQSQGRAAKHLPPDIKELRRKIQNKREDRNSNRPNERIENSLAPEGSDIRFRLKIQQSKRKKQSQLLARKEHVFNGVNSAYWDQADIRRIQAEFSYGENGNVGGERIKANLKALVRIMKKQGWKSTHISTEHSRTSSYYMEKDRVVVRVSDHELPETKERSSNRRAGFSGYWHDEFIVNAITPLMEFMHRLEDIHSLHVGDKA